ERGHYLGRVIWDGPARPNTGVPGAVAGQGARRVLRAPADGVFQGVRAIGDRVQAGETVATVAGVPVVTALDGVLRGLIHNDVHVRAGAKVGDVDPRGDPAYCFTISDKARAVGGAVLEALLTLLPT
ncbi:MAG: molybdenum hydroxylase, partial [Chloroflexi bacterium]|nr:molybdenum hydroxylase [Chloroflexota bacterium]